MEKLPKNAYEHLKQEILSLINLEEGISFTKLAELTRLHAISISQVCKELEIENKAIIEQDGVSKKVKLKNAAAT